MMDGNGHKVKIIRTKPRKEWAAEQSRLTIKERDRIRKQRLREIQNVEVESVDSRHRDYQGS